jgi:hypothetical protein
MQKDVKWICKWVQLDRFKDKRIFFSHFQLYKI